MKEHYLHALTTEAVNPRTLDIDTCSTAEIVRCINAEDMTIAEAVRAEMPQIVRAVDLIYERLKTGGRLFYVGAGTSGRLGVLDASECPPTYDTDPEMVQGIIAGGDRALRYAIEGAEDDEEAGAALIAEHGMTARDVIVGITASGYARYVLGAMRKAREAGIATIALVNNRPSLVEKMSDICVAPIVGPEVIVGSTRMKSGTATKMVLNTFTTAVMIKLGKVYGNLMVDLRATNQKLLDRAVRIVASAAEIDFDTAQQVLLEAHGDVKTAIVMNRLGVNAEEAGRLLEAAGNNVRQALALDEANQTG